MKLPIFNSKRQEKFREINGRMIVIFPEVHKREQRFIIAVEKLNKEKKEKEFDPIIEVSNAGRAYFRCSQWSQLLNLAHTKGQDFEVLSAHEYKKLILIIGERRVI